MNVAEVLGSFLALSLSTFCTKCLIQNVLPVTVTSPKSIQSTKTDSGGKTTTCKTSISGHYFAALCYRQKIKAAAL